MNNIMNDIGDSHYMSKADGIRKAVFNIMLITVAYGSHQVRSFMQ